MKNQNNLFNNAFVKYNEVVLNKLLADRKATIVEDLDDELVADAALDMREIRAVLAMFDTARENELEFGPKTTGIQLIELVTGKTWEEIAKGPSVGELASDAAGRGIQKAMGGINKFANWLGEKTKKGDA